jgi:hypothetical protein
MPNSSLDTWIELPKEVTTLISYEQRKSSHRNENQRHWKSYLDVIVWALLWNWVSCKDIVIRRYRNLGSVVKWELRKLAVCSNYATLLYYSDIIWQHIVLNSISRNNGDLFKFHYTIGLYIELLFDSTELTWVMSSTQ